MTERIPGAESAARSAGRVEHLLHPRVAAEQLRAIFAGGEHADDGRIAALAREVLRDLDAATATQWTDPGTGETYDLSVPQRDADGQFWHHIGWLTPPFGPLPLVMWSPSANREHLGTRWADVSVLERAIEDCGPLAPVRDGESGGAS